MECYEQRSLFSYLVILAWNEKSARHDALFSPTLFLVLFSPMARRAVRRQRRLLFGVSVQIPRPQRSGQACARGSAPPGPAGGIGQPVDGIRMPPVAVPPERHQRLRAMVSCGGQLHK